MNGAYEKLEPDYVTGLISSFDLLNLAFSIDGERIDRIEQVAGFRQQLEMKRAGAICIHPICRCR